MYLVISLLVLMGRMWDLIVSVPDHCLSFYFNKQLYNDFLRKLPNESGDVFVMDSFLFLRLSANDSWPVSKQSELSDVKTGSPVIIRPAVS